MYYVCILSFDRASRGLVFLGAHDIKNATEPGQLRIMVYPSNFIIFPTWNSRKLKDDIALVRLPAPIEYNGNTNTNKNTI